MSVVPIGSANETTSMYEDNSPVIQYSTALTLAGPIPPNAIETVVLGPVPPAGLTGPSVSFVSLTISFSVDCPVGETDTSTFQVRMYAAPPAEYPQPPFNATTDVVNSFYTGFDSTTTSWVISVSGFLYSTGTVTRLMCTVERVKGNDAVEISSTNYTSNLKLFN